MVECGRSAAGILAQLKDGQLHSTYDRILQLSRKFYRLQEKYLETIPNCKAILAAQLAARNRLILLDNGARAV